MKITFEELLKQKDRVALSAAVEIADDAIQAAKADTDKDAETGTDEPDEDDAPTRRTAAMDATGKASDLGAKADKASEKAGKSGSMEDHKGAYDAHKAASEAHLAAGRRHMEANVGSDNAPMTEQHYKASSLHSDMARQHMQKANDHANAILRAKTPKIHSEAICCRLAIKLAPVMDDFMFMPGGRHTIFASKGPPGAGGKSIKAEVEVGPDAAAALDRQLKTVASKSKLKPYFDFDHLDLAASFWPEEFYWKANGKDGAGVYVRGKWTEEGKKAVEGGAYQAFSPIFHVDDDKAKPAKVRCAEHANLNFGGLVNNPAFRGIDPFWAKQRFAASQR